MAFISVRSLAALAHRSDSCEASCRRERRNVPMIVRSRDRALPLTPIAGGQLREHAGRRAAQVSAKPPDVQRTSPQAIP